VFIFEGLAAVLLLATACATTPAAPARESAGPATFGFGPDTFSFRNEIRERHPDAPPGLYANYCFVLARGLPDGLAQRIRGQLADVNVQLPGELSGQLRQSTAFFSALLGGIGALAFVIGGLSLANTIAAAVFERVRDFGVKRALGASDLQLGGEVLAESLAVTLSGGVAGIAVAVGLAFVIDTWAARTGQQLFHFSPRLLGGALVFSVLLGASAAAYATARIVRLSPAEAIRRGT